MSTTSNSIDDRRPVSEGTYVPEEGVLRWISDRIDPGIARHREGASRRPAKPGERFRWEDATWVGEISLSHTFSPGCIWQVGCLYYVLPDPSGRTDWLYPRALSRSQLECWLRERSPFDEKASRVLRRLCGKDSQGEQDDWKARWARLEVATMQLGMIKKAIGRQGRKALTAGGQHG